jgi:hypothetical protein
MATITTPQRRPPSGVLTHAAPGERIPAHLFAVLFASLSVLVGVLWDISWHQSIGRDTFFSPPHLAIYLGGVVAGVACGWLVLHTTLAGSAEARAESVRFWRFFQAPLGAWVCIWGTIAMLTSAPFDDWWHNAYGLDVKILSPPHALLALGIGAINLGALLMVLPRQNRATDAATQRRLGRLFALAAGMLLLMVATIVSEYHYRIYMHMTQFYVVAAMAFPVVLVAAGRSGRMRWPVTATALVYSGITLALMWILPLFPAEPRLAPILHQVDSMVPPSFPILLVVPAVGMDVLLRRWKGGAGWLLASALGVMFVVMLVAVQWPFASFLMSDAARNPIFAADNFPYQVSETSRYFRGLFLPPQSTSSLIRGFGIALLAGTVSARIGLAWGGWMARVRR